MANANTIQFRRGSTANNDAFTGANGEFSVDTTLNQIRLHDGSTAGGIVKIGANASQLTTGTIPNARFAANLSLSGNLSVAGLSTLTGNTTLGGFVNVGTTLQVAGLSTLTGNTTLSGFVNVGTTLQVAGLSTLTGNTTVAGFINTASSLQVAGLSTLTGNTTVTGFINTASSLQVAGLSTLTGNTTHGGFVNVGTTLQVTGISTLTGNTTIGGSLGIDGGVPRDHGIIFPHAGTTPANTTNALYSPDGVSIYFNGVELATGGAATTVQITDDSSTNTTMYPVWVTATGGGESVYSSSSKLTWNPNTALLTVPLFSTTSLTLTGASGVALTNPSTNVVSVAGPITTVGSTSHITSGGGLRLASAGDIYTAAYGGISWTSNGVVNFFTSDATTLALLNANSMVLTGNNLHVTSTDGLVLQTSTAANASITQQQSPRLRFLSKVWNSGGTPATNNNEFWMEAVPYSSGTPYGQFFLKSSLNGAGANTILTITSSGNTTIAGTTTISTLTASSLVGTDSNKTLVSIGAAPFHGCLVYASANITIPNNSTTPVTFDQEVYDTDAYHSTVTNTARMTIPTGLGGYYRLTFTFQMSGSQNYSLAFYKNGSVQYMGSAAGYLSSVGTIESFSTTIALSAGDYVDVRFYQANGSDTDLIGGLASGTTTFGIELVGT